MKLITYFIIFIGIFLLTGCTEESPLSDVDLDDPSIIKPIISIDKSIYTNSVYYTATVWLFDKNNNSIDLKSGEVKLNNVTMSVKRGINNEPYYVIEPFDVLPFQLNTTYENKITLSNGQTYTSSVNSRTSDLYQLNVPSSHNKIQDMHVSWANKENDDELLLSMALYSRNDTSSTISVHEFNIPNPSSGSYSISKDYFNNPEAYKIQFTLRATNKGLINKSFMNGSKITSTISITRETNLF